MEGVDEPMFPDWMLELAAQARDGDDLALDQLLTDPEIERQTTLQHRRLRQTEKNP